MFPYLKKFKKKEEYDGVNLTSNLITLLEIHKVMECAPLPAAAVAIL